MEAALALARTAYERHAWREAHEGFLALHESLIADDLERLGVSAYMVGNTAVSDDAWARAHQKRLGSGDVSGAVRCAFWLAFRLVNAFDRSEGNGWIARIERLTEPGSPDSIEAGRLAYLTGLRAAFENDLETAARDLARSAEIASLRLDDELAALARLSLGRVRIFLGEITPGVRLLDEAMLAIRWAAMSPIAVGDSFCTAIDACYDLFDVQRGQAWTKGLTDWCARQPDLVPFAGVCQVHRSEFLQLEGAWVEAMTQAGLARARLEQPFRQLQYGAAVYQQGELHRLLGQFDAAEVCYREASSAGRDPQPGLALLRLRQGRCEEAAQAIDRALAEAEDPIGRSWLLDAYVEIMLANARVADAASGAAQLAEVASGLSSPMLEAVARRASGAVRLAEDDPRGALGDLRKASDGFRELAAPYEVARCGVLIGRARRSLGDDEGARLETDEARTTFDRLGAHPDLVALTGDRPTQLTAREQQVLRLVAAGHTNRSIGAELGLSERTIDRHMSNIFTKLGVSSRAAATALAYQSDLL
ncbi:LuxR C-terminal-related transcriptional regulator [Nocardioides sp. NPDC127503]|uniref:LuxR C-terminal-related transcriptional regulator n=1 Tax=Nocardioides sp. NPDC127503 TaxID=3154516 RepID=UPI003332CA34